MLAWLRLSQVETAFIITCLLHFYSELVCGVTNNYIQAQVLVHVTNKFCRPDFPFLWHF